MKKLLTVLFGLLLAQQAAAMTTVAGINFTDIADTLNSSTGTFSTNYGSGASAAADGNGASWVMTSTTMGTGILDVSFSDASTTPFDVNAVDLTLLFVGDGSHSGTVTLLGGSSSGTSQSFSMTASSANYTGYNSATFNSDGSTTIYGIFALNMHLADYFSGTFSGADAR